MHSPAAIGSPCVGIRCPAWSFSSPWAVSDTVSAPGSRDPITACAAGGLQLFAVSQTFPGERHIELRPVAVVGMVALVRALWKVGHIAGGYQEAGSARACCPAPLCQAVLAVVTIHLAEVAVGHIIHDGVKVPQRQVAARSPCHAADRTAPAEFTLARHLARAVEDLLTVAPIELALTETMGYCCADPAPRLPHPGPSPQGPAFGSDRQRAWPEGRHHAGPISAGLCGAGAARGRPGPPGRDRRGGRFRRGCRRSAPLPPRTTGATSIAISSTSPAENACPPR